MKAIVMSHENGGSYCIDSTGSFHFVKGYDNVDIGTEINIQVKMPSRFRKLCFAAVGVLVFVVIIGFVCVKMTGALSHGVLEGNGCEAIYVSLCVYDNSEICIADTGCTISCRRY